MLYMKQKLHELHGFKITDENNLLEQLDDFNRSVDDIENLENALTSNEIQTALKTKFLQSHGDKKSQSQAEGLNVKFKRRQSQNPKK
ncbi:hypothetical protein ACS0TY_027501 [Phlomoides rotata]